MYEFALYQRYWRMMMKAIDPSLMMKHLLQMSELSLRMRWLVKRLSF